MSERKPKGRYYLNAEKKKPATGDMKERALRLRQNHASNNQICSIMGVTRDSLDALIGTDYGKAAVDNGRCHRCKYYGTGTCNFYMNTGVRRGCPTGKDCTRFERLTGVRAHAQPFDRELARQLYDQGCTDTEIAAKVHREPATICSWRKGEHLPVNVRPYKRKWDKEGCKRLADAGWNSIEIAAEIGVSYNTVAEWMQENGYKDHRRWRL